MTAVQDKTSIGQILLNSGIITRTDLDKALRIQKERGGLLGIILVGNEFITERELIEALGKQRKIRQEDDYVNAR